MDKNEIFKIILSLAEYLSLQMEESLLLDKFESYLEERNTIYE